MVFLIPYFLLVDERIRIRIWKAQKLMDQNTQLYTNISEKARIVTNSKKRTDS
jgi:hypothetical protein